MEKFKSRLGYNTKCQTLSHGVLLHSSFTVGEGKGKCDPTRHGHPPELTGQANGACIREATLEEVLNGEFVNRTIIGCTPKRSGLS